MAKRTSSRTKRVSYVLQVTCDKIPAMSEFEFLQHMRQTLQEAGIGLDDTAPRVSVTKRIEEYVNLNKEQSK